MKYVYPAYLSLKDNLESLSSCSQKEVLLQGLYQKKQGKDYYQWLIQTLVGCDLSIEDMLKKLEADYHKNLLEFYTLEDKITS